MYIVLIYKFVYMKYEKTQNLRIKIFIAPDSELIVS